MELTTYKIDCTNIDTHWNDDFYFCEEKIISTLAKLYGKRHELIFCGTVNFSYKRDASKKMIGSQISARYADEKFFLKKYHGVTTQCIEKNDPEYSAIDVYNLCKKNIERGIPVAIGLNSESSIWKIKPGEEMIKFLPFIVVGIHEDDSLELVDVHELGIRISVSKEKFLRYYSWYTSFSAENVEKKINLEEILEEICRYQKLNNLLGASCNDIITECPNIRKSKGKTTFDETHDQYREMMDLAEDVLHMDLTNEVRGLAGPVFVPFYFSVLTLYRSRLIHTKSLNYLNEYFDFNLFDGIIRKLLVASSKWNYIRMLFSKSYHDKVLDEQTKTKISNTIKQIAEYELEVNSELNEILEKCKSGDIIEANVQENIKPQNTADIGDTSQLYLVDLSNDFNHRLFSKELTDDSNSIVDRYYYDGNVSYGTTFKDNSDYFIFPQPNQRGDSIVCSGQQLQIDAGEYSHITFIGTVLYNEIKYDYITANYEDGSQENICLGFNGWKNNVYEIGDYKKVVWKGDVRKRKLSKESETYREAKVYTKRFSLLPNKRLTSISLPDNPFICIVAVTLEKR